MTQPIPSPPPTGHRKIIHLDMDAFYASVEQRDDPGLIGQPVVVGGDPQQRGVVAAASYEARSFGIRSALPMKTALRLCPQAVRVPPNFDKYRQVSAQIHAIFHEYTDLVEPVALDEAYLDVTFNKPDIPFGSRVAKLLKADIRRELDLTASAGVAPNKFLAKIASDLEKPDGLVVVLPEEVEKFLHELPIQRIPGVGKATQQRLEGIDIHTIGELAAFDRTILARNFGKRGARFWELAHGRDDTQVIPEREPKQVSQETTFPTDVYDPEEMRDALRQLAGELSARARRRDLKGHTVVLKVRYPDFQTLTRSHSLNAFIDRATPILEQAFQLIERTEAYQRGVRLLGIGLTGFEEEQVEQLDLFPQKKADA
jgi:DNA polymerase IV